MLSGQNLAFGAAGLLILGLFVYIWNPFVSEEDRIALVLTQIENDFYMKKGENKIQYAARVNGLKRLFSESSNVDLKFQYRNSPPVNGRDEIGQAMVAVSGQLNEFRLNFYDTDIRVHEDEDKATLQTSCEINYQGDELAQASDMSFDFRKVEGEWLIESVTNDEPWEF